MSTVSGLTSKGEKGSKKFSALNINNLYKGKSLENPKTTVAPKHGLQTLGKVGAGRRIPPPANFPSLKTENAGNNPCINLVPSGGQGWVKDKEESVTSMPVSNNSSSQPRVPSPMLATSDSTLYAASTTSTVSTSVASNASVVATGAASAASAASSKTWSSVTSIQEDAGPQKNFLAHQSPFFPQEFPKLDGGVVREGDSQKLNVDSSYGPGPSLRPQTEGSWTRGTASQYSGSQQVSNGSGVNGQQSMATPEGDIAAIIPPVPRAYQPQMVGVPPRGPIPANLPLMNAGAIPGAPNLIQTGHAPMMPLSPQYRPMVSPYPQQMYHRSAGMPQGYPSPTQMQAFPAGAVPPRPPYQQYERMRQQAQMRTEEDGSYQRPTPPILSDKDLKGFDEILQSESYDDWAQANTEIDYNAKLVFSDDEENGGVSKKESSKSERQTREEKAIDVKRERSKSERDSSERENDKDEKRYRPPHNVPPTTQQVSRHYDYRGSSGPPPPQQQQQQFSSTSGNFAIRNRSESIADDDEMWRLRSRQHSDEMTAAVARARQRREEEEKKFAQSRQAAQEKAKALEEKARSSAEKDKENTDSDERSLTRDSRDNKQQSGKQDFRGVNYNANFASKQFPKNIPPRFQKLQAQQQQQQMQHQQQQSPGNNSPQQQQQQHFGSNRYELVSNQRGTPFEQQTGYGYHEVKQQSTFNRLADVTPDVGSNVVVESQRHDRQKHLEENWRTQNEFNSRINDKTAESLRNEKASCDDMSGRVRVQSRKVLQREDRSGDGTSTTSVQRPDSRSSFSSRDDPRSKYEEKKHAFERQESSQSSQSDKRSTSSRDDRPKKCERLDWASECDNVSIASSNGSSHFGSVKRERHRPVVPVTQKHFNAATEGVKSSGLTTLKKDDVKQPINESSSKKSEEKSVVAPVVVSQPELSVEVVKDKVTPNVDNKVNVFANCDTKDSPLISSTVETTKRSENERRESSRRSGGRDRGSDKPAKSETSHDVRNFKDDSKEHAKDRDSNYDRDYNYRQSFRGREYRRSRGGGGPGEKSKQDKFGKGPPSLPPRKLSKSRRHTQRSDDSLASEDFKKDKELETHKSKMSENVTDSNRQKAEYDNEKQNLTSNAPHRDDSKKGRGAFRSSRGRPYGFSNYGPPPSKAAFGDTKNVSGPRNSENNYPETKNEKRSRERNSESYKSDLVKSSSKEGSSSQNSAVNHVGSSSHKNDSGRNQKDKSSYRRAADPGDVTANREDNVPPRFQKRQGNYRSGRGSKQSCPGRGDRVEHVRRQRTSSNQESSDIGNDEWETESEMSDIERRGDGRRNDRIQQQQAQHTRKESKGHRRNDKRKDQQKSQQSSQRGPDRNRNNRGNSSPHSNNQDSQSAVKNGPTLMSTKGDTIALAVSDVTLDNPQAIGEAIADMKERQKSKSKSQPMQSVSAELDEGFQKVSYKKRRSSNEKQKNELSAAAASKLNQRNRFPKLPPRLAKQKETTKLTSFGDEISESNVESEIIKSKKESIEQLSKATKDLKISGAEKVVEPTVNAWTKPLSHALQAPSNTVVTTVACSTKPATVKTGVQQQQPLGLSSKSSSFDQQDSGIDVSDQPASTASSQRSSPSNDDNNKPVTTTAKTAPVNVISTSKDTVSEVADDLDARKPVTTVIFQNKNLKEENDVLDKFGKPHDKKKKQETTGSKQYLASDESASKTISSLSSDSSAKDTFRKMDEEEGNSKLGFNFKEEKSSPGASSQAVNKAVGTPRSSSDVKNVPISTSVDELNQHLKIASVKKVWEMPTVLENNVEESVVSESLNYDNQKAKQSAITNAESTGNALTNLSASSTAAAMVTGHTWSNARHVPFTSQDVNKVKANTAAPYAQQVMNNQLGPQSLLFSSSPPNIANHMSSHLDGYRQIPNYQMTGLPPISSPPNLIYNTQTQISASALSFAHQMKNFPQVMAQIAAATPATAYQQHHNILMSHQNNTLSQPNIYMPTPNQASVNQSVADRYRVNAAHQNLAAAPHLMKSQFTVQPNPQAVQGLHRIPVATSTAFYSNQAQPGYFQQATAGSTLQQQQAAYGYASPQQPLLTAANSQVNPQQSYRNVPVAIGRSDNGTIRSPSGKYNYR